MASTSKTGRLGEGLARQFLEKKGYRIVTSNYRGGGGEIDIIAATPDSLVFVEVKTARTKAFGAPETWVDEKKQEQIGNVAEHYLFEHQLDDVDCRFDIVTVTMLDGRAEIKHFENAFNFL
jgi:putative endonuclease